VVVVPVGIVARSRESLLVAVRLLNQQSPSLLQPTTQLQLALVALVATIRHTPAEITETTLYLLRSHRQAEAGAGVETIQEIVAVQEVAQAILEQEAQAPQIKDITAQTAPKTHPHTLRQVAVEQEEQEALRPTVQQAARAGQAFPHRLQVHR